MNEHQKIVFVNKINMNRDQSALQMISHVTGIPSKILSYGWARIEVLRQVHSRDWIKMEFAPWSISQHLSRWHSSDWASPGNPPALLPSDSYFSLQASLAFTLSCPRQPPLEMHWANNGVGVARCSQQRHQCPWHFVKKTFCDFLKKSFFRKWNCTWHLHSEALTSQCPVLLHFPYTHPHSHWKLMKIRVPLPSHPKVSRRQECEFIQCWSLQQMLNTRVAPFGASIAVFSIHEQTSKQILKATLKSHVCLWTAKQEHFLPQIQV